jgi:hypothetical protein
MIRIANFGWKALPRGRRGAGAGSGGAERVRAARVA